MEETNINNIENTEGKSYKKGILLGVVIGILFMCFLYGCFSIAKIISDRGTLEKTDNVINQDTLKKIQNIQKIIDSNLYTYNEDISADNLEEGIYRGMLKSLGDKYAEYYSVEDMQQVSNDTEGVSYGIGCYVTLDDNNLPLVYGVMDDSPAQKAGIREGDIIAYVDGTSTVGLSLSEVVGLIKGIQGTTVEVTLSRDGKPVELTLTREKMIETTTVESGVLIDNENIGYIRIKEFDDVTVNQFKEALTALEDEEHVKGLIIDLRSNPGGNITSVVDIARELLPEGIIVYTENNKGIRKDYTCDGANEIDIPLVVLVNEYSASASEILAGAIQDYNKGTLLGTTTYGKGIVQSILSVGDGSMVKITTSAYFTPNGRNIQGTGIEPDIVLEYDYDAAEANGTDNQVNRAQQILEDKIGD